MRIEGRKDPVTIHCSQNVPNLLIAAHRMMEKVGSLLGSAAVAEDRRRAEAAAAPFAADDQTTGPSGSQAPPSDFFQHMKRVRQLEAEKTVADAHVRDADAHLQSALLLVSAEERAVKQAQPSLDE